MSSNEGYEVHLGFWTNWSHGKVRGATLTLTHDNGTLLIALLALFVTAAGKSLWRITCFVLHFLLSQPTTPQDGWYHQRQAILRNSESALHSGQQLIWSMVAWKRKSSARHVFRQGIPIATAAIALSCGITLASIFSSQVLNEDANEVLLSGKKCGFITPPQNIRLPAYGNAFNSWNAQRYQRYTSYVQSCYQNVSATNNCNIYVIKQLLPLQIDRNYSCPFTGGICQSEFGNVKLDTGYIDTHEHLGINASPKNRFLLRHTYYCAPLKTKGFTGIILSRARNESSSETSHVLFYGGISRESQIHNNITYRYHEYGTSPIADYALGTVIHYTGGNGKQWNPIPQLRRPGSDLTAFFLSAPGIDFEEQTDDPWFSAHKKAKRTNWVLGNMTVPQTLYMKDEPVTTVACASQLQYCIPGSFGDTKKRCEQPHGDQEEPKWNGSLSGHEKKLHNALDKFLSSGSPYDVASILGSLALQARSRLSRRNQGALNRYQWQVEMENIVKIHLVSMQDIGKWKVTGPPSEELKEFWQQPAKNDTVAWSICSNQKVIDPRFPSFSVLGLSVILIIGFLMIGLEFSLPFIVRYFYRRRWKWAHDQEDPHLTDEDCLTDDNFSRDDRDAIAQQSLNIKILKHAEWNTTSTLQLQRLAFESTGSGIWHGTSSETPVTLPNQLLATLSFKKPHYSHPYLAPSSPGDDDVNIPPTLDSSTSTMVQALELTDTERHTHMQRDGNDRIEELGSDDSSSTSSGLTISVSLPTVAERPGIPVPG